MISVPYALCFEVDSGNSGSKIQFSGGSALGVTAHLTFYGLNKCSEQRSDPGLDSQHGPDLSNFEWKTCH